MGKVLTTEGKSRVVQVVTGKDMENAATEQICMHMHTHKINE